MDKFIELYNGCKNNQKQQKQQTQETIQTFLNYGVYLIKSLDEIEAKQFIFEKLRELFPNDPSIYYYMGFELKKTNKDQAFDLFSMSFHINPKNLENIIEVFSYLVDKKAQKDVVKLVEQHNLLDFFIKDWRILCLYYECIRKYSNVKCMQYIQKTINILEAKASKTKEETIGYHQSYTHLITTHIHLSNHDIAMKMIEKHLILITRDKKIDNDTILHCLSSYLYVSNFYYDLDITDKFTDLYNDRFISGNEKSGDNEKGDNEKGDNEKGGNEKSGGNEKGDNEKGDNISFVKNTDNSKIPIEIFKALNIVSRNKRLKLSTKKNKKIRIGYMSSDFIKHAVSNFILPILKHHTDLFDIYLFTISDNNEELMQYNYYNINNMKDEEIAILINDLKIDMLFDLNGNTGGNKLGVFSYKPAPIAISYIGCPITSGLDTIDYYLTDGIADSVDTKQIYSETLLRMPRFQLLYDSQIKPLDFYENLGKKSEFTSSNIYNDVPLEKETVKLNDFAVIEKKSVCAISNLCPSKNKIVLGSLNKEAKTNKLVLNTWKAIMKQCPECILLIRFDLQDDMQERIAFYVKHLDVDKKRLILVSHLDDEQYFRLYQKIDILLDTFPYSGTTTSCNALYNSIPIVTLYKENNHAHNMTTSLLINTGFPELVAYSTEEYIEKVVDLINMPDKLESYKTNIQGKFMELMEPNKFIQEYEELLLNTYNNHMNR